MSPHRNGFYSKTFALRSLVEEVVQSLALRLDAQAIETTLDIPWNQMLTADREMLRRAVRNLVLNAAAAMPDGGSLVVTSASTPDAVELEIADSGPSMSDEGRRHAFDLVGIDERGATGCTLAIVRRIAEFHGGSLSVANCPDGGVALTLRVPHPIALEAAA
ncbi:MAG: HAMP domain-containing sensor histidine kinase [Thermoguttaceae bacterium]